MKKKPTWWDQAVTEFKESDRELRDAARIIDKYLTKQDLKGYSRIRYIRDLKLGR